MRIRKFHSQSSLIVIGFKDGEVHAQECMLMQKSRCPGRMAWLAGNSWKSSSTKRQHMGGRIREKIPGKNLETLCRHAEMLRGKLRVQWSWDWWDRSRTTRKASTSRLVVKSKTKCGTSAEYGRWPYHSGHRSSWDISCLLCLRLHQTRSLMSLWLGIFFKEENN